jgi:predicted ATPase
LVKLYLNNFGPFEEAEVELKPLTIFIGRNSTGKSMLLYLLWALSSAEPLPDRVEAGWEPVVEIAEKVVRGVKEGRIGSGDLEELVRAYVKVLEDAVKHGLEERFRYALGVELKELVRIGRDKAVIEVHGRCAKIRFSLEDEVKIEEFDLCIEDMLRKVDVRVLRKGYVRVDYGSYLKKYRVYSIADVVDLVVDLLFRHTAVEFSWLALVTPNLTCMLPDSRAGITRTLLKPYISPTLLSGVLGVDREYVSTYFRLAEWLSRNPGVVELIRPLLEELGVTVDVRFESGVYNIYVKSWSNKVMPLTMAPSGVREAITVALALLMVEPKELVPVNVFIEEPEAHLHPRAQRTLAGIISRAVNMGKKVVVTTHSDYLISALNNLIALSRLPSRRLKRLGYTKEEVLSPESVAAYLVRAEGDKAVVEKLQVTGEGVPEDEFAKVAEELLGERGRIYDEIEKVQAGKP